ncbi:MAG: hypothetical protein JW804_03595 [Sedimentisphaerales bacterium]|nr:hypothetical protein [Sedimentisphaerales bacterium]
MIKPNVMPAAIPKCKSVRNPIFSAFLPINCSKISKLLIKTSKGSTNADIIFDRTDGPLYSAMRLYTCPQLSF